jgi:hypothetical protein
MKNYQQKFEAKGGVNLNLPKMWQPLSPQLNMHQEKS